jgi:HD superfamily phosphohydrolase
VAYGRFDHFRLIDTLRILPVAPEVSGGESREPTLGIEHGGRESAEALLLARYSMFSQVYLHRTRRIYDIHLKDFMQEWLKTAGQDGRFSTVLDDHLAMTDNEVLAAIGQAIRSEVEPLRILARRIVERGQRFAAIYEPSPADLRTNVDAARQVADALIDRYGEDAVRPDRYVKEDIPPVFSIQQRDRAVVASTGVSPLLSSIPAARSEYVFLDRQYLRDAQDWLAKEKDWLIEQPSSEEEEDP